MAQIVGYVFRTTDQERLTAFLTCIGLSFVKEKHGGGPVHFACEVDNASVFELYERTKKNADDTLLVHVDSIQETLKKLKKEKFLDGQSVEGSPDGRQAVVYTPDGRPVLLFEVVPKDSEKSP